MRNEFRKSSSWAVHAVRVQVELKYAGGSFLCVIVAEK